jgi:transglutaminase-like putative cysteine protease
VTPGPALGSLMPTWLARLVGFGALAALGALEWQRMVAALPSARALLWVLTALATAVALLACDRLPARRRGAGTVAAAAGGLLAGFVTSGAEVALLGPRRWDDLAGGLHDGAQTLGTVRLPYTGSDPWPATTLELIGAELLVLAALIAFWPRPASEARAAGAGRGYPFLSLALLLVLVASPVVSLGGTRPVALGAVLTALCVCFLWLERLPLRPGLGVAALLGVALAGALPLAAAADRGEQWFDYKSFAEGLGPDDPVHFAWDQSYGAIDWPREGNEILRVTADEAFYWKAANLEDFDGEAWRERRPGEVTEARDAEVPEDWRNRPAWTSTIAVSVRRMRSRAVISAGTTMAVLSSSKPMVASPLPGMLVAQPDVRRGDSYTLQVHVPKPPPGTLHQSTTGSSGEQADDLLVELPFRAGEEPTYHQLGRGGEGWADRAVLHVRPYGDKRGDFLEFPGPDVSRFDIATMMRRTLYWRTWRLAQRLKRGTHTPLEYILRVNRYLQTDFGYSERPTEPPPGRAPLDAFLFDTKEGYCQHFSGAMALLLRMGGVPARVVSGFSPGGYSKRRNAWIVRDTDAHAWVEAWFDRSGWVTYDPTPDSTPARSQIAALEELPPPAPTSTAATGAGGGAGATGQRPGGLRPDLLLDRAAGWSGSASTAPAEQSGAPWWRWALGALAAAALAALVVRRRRRRRRAPLPPIERAIAELDSALRRSGRPTPTGTTLRQLEARLGDLPGAVAYLRALSGARYGPAPHPPTVAQRRAMRRALGEGLGVTGRVRAWWALPPRAR